jgi:hypothetical protein
MKYYEKRPEALEVLELTDDNKNEILQSGLTITLRRTEIGTLEYFTKWADDNTSPNRNWYT